jgi:beta-glucosidase
MDEKFPKNFLWGAAVSSYQVEGNNFNSDWWEWEQNGKTKEKSGKACDYWNRYKEDHDLLQELGVNSFRLSLEWSRIEPQEGKFSEEAIQHYREILQDLKRRNIKTVVTFWHWTSPIWFQKKYGFHKNKSVGMFLRYGEKVIDELGNMIDVAVIINEPMMPLVFGYLIGKYPPGFKNLFKYFKAFNNLSDSYKKIYDYAKEKNAKFPIGITQLYNFVEPKSRYNLISLFSVWAYKRFWNDSFLKSTKNSLDYIGLDYYFHHKINYFFLDDKKENMGDLGWEIYPEGIYRVIKELNLKYKLPIYIMENGIADAEDKLKAEFIEKHLEYVYKAIKEGMDVRGYNYWSLLDNYEWLYGFGPRFGLVEVNYATMERKPRKSFYFYHDLIKRYSK